MWKHSGHRGFTEEKEEIGRGISGAIIGSAMKVHTRLGPGLLEAAYEECLCRQFSIDGLAFRRQVEVPMEYEGVRLDCGFRMDLLVSDSVVVEIKAVPALLRVHHSQLLTYLRISGKRLGLLINFHVDHLRDGIKRIAN